MTKHFATIFLSQLLLTMLLFSCSQPYDKIKNKCWEGEIYRSSDDKRLSYLKLEMRNDTLFLFSNAIFGSDNDTLILQQVEEKDSIFTYKSLEGNIFKFKLAYERNDNLESLYLFGNDYYIALGTSSLGLWEDGSLDFYECLPVPRESYMYLDGAYEGELEMENQLSNLYLTGIGGISVKLVFIDNFKVKIYFKSLFLDLFSDPGKPTYDVVNYRIIGNKLYLENNKSKVQIIEVEDYGETLVLAKDEASIVMHKIY